MDSRRSGGDGQPVSIATNGIISGAQPQRSCPSASQLDEQILHADQAPAHVVSQSRASGQAQLQQGWYPCDNHREHLASQHRLSEHITRLPSRQQQNQQFSHRGLHGEAVLARIEASLAEDDTHRANIPPFDNNTTIVSARRQSAEIAKRNSGFDNVLVAMIREGEQCTIQQPRELNYQPATADYQDFLHMDDEDYEMLGLVRTLKVDCQMTSRTEHEHMPGLRETFKLSTSRQPHGVIKSGTLRYRTSGEAGLNCRALKRSMPRMRRRPKTTATQCRARPGHEDITRPGTATSVA